MSSKNKMIKMNKKKIENFADGVWLIFLFGFCPALFFFFLIQIFLSSPCKSVGRLDLFIYIRLRVSDEARCAACGVLRQYTRSIALLSGPTCHCTYWGTTLLKPSFRLSNWRGRCEVDLPPRSSINLVHLPGLVSTHHRQARHTWLSAADFYLLGGLRERPAACMFPPAALLNNQLVENAPQSHSH